MPSGYNTISCPRAMLLHGLPPPLGISSVVHATNKPRKQHLQCQPIPANAILPSPWPRLPRRTTCGGEPRPSVSSPDPNTNQESRDRRIRQHQSARKGGCPATRARGHTRTHGYACHHRHSCGMPFALYESLTSPCMMASLDNGWMCRARGGDQPDAVRRWPDSCALR